MTPSDAAPANSVRRLFDLRPGEGAAVAWAWVFVFSIFLSYSVMRPIRDELGVAGGVRNLPWLFTGTLIAMLALQPLYAALVRRLPRERFIAITYRFFMANILVFMVLLAVSPADQHVWIGRAFFIWVSVFNLFVVSVFWSFAVDLFDEEQGKRLFGLLATGATVGFIAGSSITSGLVGVLSGLLGDRAGQAALLVVSILLLEVGVLAVRRLSGLSAAFQRPTERAEADRTVGGGILAGLTHTLRSPYLLGIAAFMLLYTITSTFLYTQQAIVAEGLPSRAARTEFFANIELAVNVLTLGVQLFLTGRLMGALGVAITLSALPLFSVLGFAALAVMPTLAVFVVVQVSRRVSNFALARPTREVLFTSVPREDKYKAKNFIDTVVYRLGDQVGIWAGVWIAALGMGAVAMLAVPVSLVWLGISYWLGRQQERRAAEPEPVPARA